MITRKYFPRQDNHEESLIYGGMVKFEYQNVQIYKII